MNQALRRCIRLGFVVVKNPTRYYNEGDDFIDEISKESIDILSLVPSKEGLGSGFTGTSGNNYRSIQILCCGKRERTVDMQPVKMLGKVRNH